MKFKVLLPQYVSDAGKKYLRENDCEIVELDDHSLENICKNIVDCDALLVRTAQIPKEVFEAGEKLKVIGRHGAGFDNIDLKAAAQYNVKVCNTPEAIGDSVAEHTMAMLLACAKKIVFMDKATRSGDWGMRNRIRTSALTGKTLGIIGFGNIGKLAAKKAALGFDMNVLVLKHHPGKGELPDYVKECFSLDEIFAESDFLSLHTPLTDETLKLVNKERLSMMKPTAYLINTTRGPVVDEAALYEALKQGTIAGAALDVFEEEPASKDNPLFTLDNIIVSAHNASHTQESMDRMSLDAAIGIIEVLNGKKVTWPVN